MHTTRNILIAFLLNLLFSVFEFFGGIFTGSIAILSDAAHDFADAVTIGLSYFMERKSKQHPDDVYTYGYARYSIFGSMITSAVLVVGSLVLIYHAVGRIFAPTQIRYDFMIVFALAGVCVNGCAAYFTHGGDSLNQKAVNLHMLEDVLGWVVVLIGAIVMRFTDFALIDPLMSIGVAVFILYNAYKTLKQACGILLEKTTLDTNHIRAHICALDEVKDVHHIHLWSLDAQQHCATMHIVSDGDPAQVKEAVKHALHACGIAHATIELEKTSEHCHDKKCHITPTHACCHHHH